MHTKNVQSIITNGILCRYRIGMRPDILHADIGDPEIISRRARRYVGRVSLDRYVNLFFNARNAMLFRRVQEYGPQFLAILRLNPSVLDRAGVVITEINAAASDAPRWYGVVEGLARLRAEEIFVESWQDSDPDLVQRMMAEVLVPNNIPPEYLIGAYMFSEDAASGVSWTHELPITISPAHFFQ